MPRSKKKAEDIPQAKKTPEQEREQEERLDFQGTPPIRYVLEGEEGFYAGAPGKDQVTVYDLTTRQMAVVLPSKQEAQAWADKKNSEQQIEKKKEPRKP